MDVKEQLYELVRRDIDDAFSKLCISMTEINNAKDAGVDLSKYAAPKGDNPHAGATAQWVADTERVCAAARDFLGVPDSFDVTGEFPLSAMYQPPAWAQPTLKPTSSPVPPAPVEPIIPADRYDEIAPLLNLEPPGTRVQRALAFINSRRRGVQRALDPKAAGWTDDDVLAEAKRLGWRG